MFSKLHNSLVLILFMSGTATEPSLWDEARDVQAGSCAFEGGTGMAMSLPCFVLDSISSHASQLY